MKTVLEQEARMKTVLKETIKEAVLEAFEDIALGKAIQEGITPRRVGRREVFEILNRKRCG